MKLLVPNLRLFVIVPLENARLCLRDRLLRETLIKALLYPYGHRVFLFKCHALVVAHSHPGVSETASVWFSVSRFTFAPNTWSTEWCRYRLVSQDTELSTSVSHYASLDRFCTVTPWNTPIQCCTLYFSSFSVFTVLSIWTLYSHEISIIVYRAQYVTASITILLNYSNAIFTKCWVRW